MPMHVDSSSFTEVSVTWQPNDAEKKRRPLGSETDSILTSANCGQMMRLQL